MVRVKCLRNNSIITLESEGKMPIKSSSGLMFHNANELLCSAVGSCIGRELVLFGNHNNVNIEEFEYIGVGMDNEEIIILVKSPSNLSDELKDDLTFRFTNCNMSRMLSIPIKVTIQNNELSKEQLEAYNASRKGCCGGN